MTTNEAKAIAAQLGLVPRRAHLSIHNVATDDRGRGVMEVVTDASQQTLSAWLKQVGAMVTRVEDVPGRLHSVIWFDWA